MKWKVEIVEDATGRVVRTLGESNAKYIAEKIERGVNINLDRDRFSTRIVPPKEKKKKKED